MSKNPGPRNTIHNKHFYDRLALLLCNKISSSILPCKSYYFGGDIFGSQNKLIRLGYFCAPPVKKAIMFLLMPIFCIFLNLIFLQSIWWMHCKRREMIGKFTLNSFAKTLIKDKLAAEDIQIKSDKCANFK